MEQIRDAQEFAKENMPENLQGSEAYDAAENSIEIMNEVIERLHEIY